MLQKQINYGSSNKLHDINAKIFVPDDKKYKGIVQIAHGMLEHIGKYLELAKYLTDNGYVVAISEHAGHGYSIKPDGVRGRFGKHGDDVLLDDFNYFYKYLKRHFKDLPYYILGHSMGSFIVRKFMYIHRDYDIRGYIVMGTGGMRMDMFFAQPFIKTIARTHVGNRDGNFFVKKSFSTYNEQVDRRKGNWLSTDEEYLAWTKTDKLAKFSFSVAAYASLFSLIIFTNLPSWFRGIKKDTNIILMSGTEDVVGENGEGVIRIYKNLLRNGVKNTKIKLYKGYRHEILHEVGKEIVFKDILDYLNLLL